MSSDSAAKPHRVKRVLLACGLVLGLCMTIVPFIASAIGIARASLVPGGLRGATHVPAMEHRVGFALGSASLPAILAPPGVFVDVGRAACQDTVAFTQIACYTHFTWQRPGTSLWRSTKGPFAKPAC